MAKDLDARWTEKDNINYYGYKSSICVDVDNGSIRRYAITPANVHNSQLLPRLLDPENEHDCLWSDSAYSGERFENLLNHAGFESLIHEKAPSAWKDDASPVRPLPTTRGLDGAEQCVVTARRSKLM